MSEPRIAGKNVLIVGGAKNLGGLIARDLAGQGATAVAIHYNSDATRPAADDTLAAIKAAGVGAHAFQADLTSAPAVKAAARRLGTFTPILATDRLGQVNKVARSRPDSGGTRSSGSQRRAA